MNQTKRDTFDLRKEALRFRNVLIKVNADIFRLINPKIFSLLKENVNNLRNLAIISGAMASFALLIIDSGVGHKSLLEIGVTGLLINIIFIVIYLNKIVSSGINSYNLKLKAETRLSLDGQEIINNFLDGRISQEEYKKEMQKLFKKIEQEKIRSPLKEEAPKKDYTADLLAFLFSLSTITIIASLFFIRFID